MKRITKLTAVLSLLAMAAVARAQDAPEMPKPSKQHELLAQFTGKWKTRAEAASAPGEEPMVCEGIETARLLGGFFLVGETRAEVMGQPMESVVTVGYDDKRGKYVGTFVCSASGDLWNYEGEMDASGKKLTLHTEGPSCIDRTKHAKYREIYELKDADHKVFTSEMELADGKWQPIVTVTYERMK